MNLTEKVHLYNKNAKSIHQKIKSDPQTKPLWRRLFWTTGRNSDEYKAGSLEIYQEYFPDLFKSLSN